MTAALASLATDEYRARSEAAIQRVRQGRWTREQAHDRLWPWLAMALAAGADLAALIGIPQRWPVLSSDICPRDQWLAELERARNAALDTPAMASTPRARRLCTLANTLGCGPYIPAAAQSAPDGQQERPAA